MLCRHIHLLPFTSEPSPLISDITINELLILSQHFPSFLTRQTQSQSILSFLSSGLKLIITFIQNILHDMTIKNGFGLNYFFFLRLLLWIPFSFFIYLFVPVERIRDRFAEFTKRWRQGNRWWVLGIAAGKLCEFLANKNTKRRKQWAGVREIAVRRFLIAMLFLKTRETDYGAS